MRKAVLLLVLLMAFALRIWNIQTFPVGFNADEASFGYDAYSILTTGRDQWGNFLPITLKSFGDYKSPLYSYLTIPSVAIFGLTQFAVRLPGAIIGTLAVFMVYLLVKEILDRYKKLLSFNIYYPALIAAVLLAVNPWHVMMSRGAFEANLITFFLPAGIYFFLRGLKNVKLMSLSSIFFGLDLFSYHSAKVITPIIIIGLVLIFRGELRKIKFKNLLLPLLIFLVFFVGLLYTFAIGGASRAVERSITQGALEEGAVQKISAISQGQNPIIARILHNKYQIIAQRFSSNYLQYFSFRYLFTNGAGESTYGMIPGIGVIYIFEALLFLGIIPLLVKKESRSLVVVLLLWLIIAPIPAALATGVGFAGNRSEGMIPVLQILEGLGGLGWLSLVKTRNKALLWGITVFFGVSILLSFVNFLRLYFKTPSALVARGMLFGDLEAASWLADNSKGETVFISRSLSEPQIFVAFANKWNPTDYQKATRTWGFDGSNLTWVDQLPEYQLGNYIIGSIDWKTDINRKDILLVGLANELPQGIIPSKIFYYSDGTPLVSVVATSKLAKR